MLTTEQRLREWCYAAKDKAGQKRQELDVTTCFVPLLQWVISLWTGNVIALAIDATTLGDRFVVLTISVVYRSCAIPVAWTILVQPRKGAWRRHWLRMLRQLRPAIPADWVVLVMADRGLYAGWLFRRIVRLGWHPFLRINQGAKFRPSGHPSWYWLPELVGQVGSRWRGQGTAFKSHGRQLECTLVAWWGARLRRTVVHLDRLAAHRLRCGLVWAACLVRTGLQMHQARRLAVAANPYDRPPTGNSPLASLGRSLPVDGQPRQRPGSWLLAPFTRLIPYPKHTSSSHSFAPYPPFSPGATMAARPTHYRPGAAFAATSGTRTVALYTHPLVAACGSTASLG